MPPPSLLSFNRISKQIAYEYMHTLIAPCPKKKVLAYIIFLRLLKFNFGAINAPVLQPALYNQNSSLQVPCYHLCLLYTFPTQSTPQVMLLQKHAYSLLSWTHELERKYSCMQLLFYFLQGSTEYTHGIFGFSYLLISLLVLKVTSYSFTRSHCILCSITSQTCNSSSLLQSQR